MAKMHKGKYCPPKNYINNVIGYPQSETNRTNVVPVAALNNYELDIASGAVPPDTTYEEWREMQSMATNALQVMEYGDNV